MFHPFHFNACVFDGGKGGKVRALVVRLYFLMCKSIQVLMAVCLMSCILSPWLLLLILLDPRIAACSYIWGSSSEAARNPLCFYVFLLLLLLSWGSMAAHRTVWSKVVKFCTLIQDSPMLHVSKFHVGTSYTLAPPTGQS